MSKLAVKICLGTTCFVMGGSELQELPEKLPASYKKLVSISGCPCLGQCGAAATRAPYVLIGDELLSEASIEKILKKITEKLNHAQ
jgi:NADH:ubiquinone oxidoreductase subunit E